MHDINKTDFESLHNINSRYEPPFRGVKTGSLKGKNQNKVNPRPEGPFSSLKQLYDEGVLKWDPMTPIPASRDGEVLADCLLTISNLGIRLERGIGFSDRQIVMARLEGVNSVDGVKKATFHYYCKTENVNLMFTMTFNPDHPDVFNKFQENVFKPDGTLKHPNGMYLVMGTFDKMVCARKRACFGHWCRNCNGHFEALCENTKQIFFIYKGI